MKSFIGYLTCLALVCKIGIAFANDEAELDSVEKRLDAIQSSLNLMFMEASEQIEALTTEVRGLKQSLDHLGWYAEQVKQSVATVQNNNELLLRNLTILTMRSDEIVANQQYCANHEALKNTFFELTPKCGAFNSTPKPPPPETIYHSCAEVPQRSGVYALTVNETGQQYKAYCEMNQFGGGWTVFQKRQDGSVDFNRSWADYRQGFGNASGEYWLGLQTLHELTTRKSHELLVILENFNGSSSYVRYSGIVVDNELQRYRVYFNSSGNGTAGDSLYVNRNEVFVTYDVQTGTTYRDCARELSSGFWHYSCGTADSRNNVNGVYGSTASKKGIWWYNSFPGFLQYNPLKGVQMMIRENMN